jgi:hypothetical protein
MVTLQGPDLDLLLASCSDAPGCGQGPGQGGDIGYFIPDSRLANVRVISFAQLATRGVDHQVNFPVFNNVHNVGPALV